MQQATYKRLSDSEREEISRGLASGESQARLARRLERSASTISREIGRNQDQTGYRAFSAGRRAERRLASRRLDKRRLIQDERLRSYVRLSSPVFGSVGRLKKSSGVWK